MTAVIHTLLVAIGLGLFARTISGRVKLLLRAAPDARFDRIGERIKSVLVYAFGQKKFLIDQRERQAGWMHFFIFWGFMVLGVKVVTAFSQGWLGREFHLPGLGVDQFGGPYLLLKDLIELAVLVAIIVAFYRWLVAHPERLFGFAPAENRKRGESHWEAFLILSFIAGIMITDLLYDAGRFIYDAGSDIVTQERQWEPFASMLAALLDGIGDSAARTMSEIGWWGHNVIILVFLNMLPRSKHFHIITSLPNVFFRKLEPLGALNKMDLENSETFGTSRIEQFTWKQVLDMYTCTECGRCSSMCPATATGKPLAPRQLLLDLRDYLYSRQKELVAKGPGDESEGEVIVGNDKVIHDDVLWSCNVCRACEEACPVIIEYVDKIVDMRRHLVQEEARFPTELTRTFKGMETQSNPWGLGAEKRGDWAQGLDIPLMSEKGSAEYLYYVGCAGAFDDRNKKTSVAFAKILKHAGVDFAILGPEELCNGECARRLGNEYLFQMMAQALVEVFGQYKVKKILVNCPHCYNSLKNEYPQFGGNYEIIHAADFVLQLVNQGKLKLKENGFAGKRITYHDSCNYGRFNGIYEEPRDLIARATGQPPLEMERNRRAAMCCGAGGGRMWLEEAPDQRVNIARTEQALATNPDAVLVSCPFCMTMVDDGVKSKEMEERVQVLDLMELVAKSLA